MTNTHSAYYVRLGRAPDCDWVIQVPTVSAWHCQVYWAPQAGSYVLEDLQSTHGTWLNGERLPQQRSAPVKIGDEIRLGSRVVFRFAPHHVQKLARPGQAWTSLPLPELERMVVHQASPEPERTTARQSNVRMARAEAWGIASPYKGRASEVVDIWQTSSEEPEPGEIAPRFTQSPEMLARSDMPLVLVSPSFVRLTTLLTLGLASPLWTVLTFHSAERLQQRAPTFADGFVAGLLGPMWLLYIWLIWPSEIAAAYPVQAARLNFEPRHLACVVCVPVVGPAVWLNAVTALLQAVWTEERVTLSDTEVPLGRVDRAQLIDVLRDFRVG